MPPSRRPRRTAKSKKAGPTPGRLELSPDVAGRRERLVELCTALPEGQAEPARQHIAFRVGKRIFAYYVYDHHGDGRIALLCKAYPGEQERLVRDDPERYFIPPYVGPRGWVGFRLDTPRLDWGTVKSLVFAASTLLAPEGPRVSARRAPRTRRRLPKA